MVEHVAAFLDSLPAILRILTVFCLVLITMKFKWSLGNAFLMGALALGLLFHMAPVNILSSAGRVLIDPKTLGIGGVVALILVLSHSLEASGQMQRLLANFSGLIQKPALNLVIFPALIGLLPMPGGAVFSAPMVKHLGQRHELSGQRLSYTNYWFRHIWEYWWPLYPGVLLTTALAQIDLWYFVMCMAPLTLVALGVGYWPLWRDLAKAAKASPSLKKPPWRPFLKELAPIVFVIVAGLGGGWMFGLGLSGPLQAVSKELGLMVALVVAIGWVWAVNQLPRKTCLGILRHPALLKMLYMIVGIFVFKGILLSSGAVALISAEFIGWKIPLQSIAVLLPLLVGLVSGITIAFVGATFPILIALIDTLGQTQLMMPYMMLATVSGFAGVLLSPLHLCLQLSNQYFETPLVPVYKQMGIPLVALLVGGGVYFALWGNIF